MYEETVTEVEHYTDALFRFKTTRNKSFRFENGEFAMIGLHSEKYNKDIFRAYSICSTNYEDHLEFLSIKVPDGPLTSMLQHTQPGDKIKIKPKTTGSLVIDYLTPKDNLVLLSTGTGLAPFMSIVRDFRTYEKFNNVYLFHTVRNSDELAFRSELNELQTQVNLTYVDTVTEHDYVRKGRFWNHLDKYLKNGIIKDRDAVMVCGSPSLNKECRQRFSVSGWKEGNTGELGDFLLERAFVD